MQDPKLLSNGRIIEGRISPEQILRNLAAVLESVLCLPDSLRLFFPKKTMNPERFESGGSGGRSDSEAFYEELNLGILIEESSKRHSAALGRSHWANTAEDPRAIRSSCITVPSAEYCGRTDEVFWQKKIREVLRHEFRHHMEGTLGNPRSRIRGSEGD